jgi:hypothetical protein
MTAEKEAFLCKWKTLVKINQQVCLTIFNSLYYMKDMHTNLSLRLNVVLLFIKIQPIVCSIPQNKFIGSRENIQIKMLFLVQIWELI